MEALAIQAEYVTQEQHEQQMRYDLQTQFAELVDGNMRTNFELIFNGHDLVGEDGRSLGEVTSDALDDARQTAKKNPNLWFEIRRRSFERDEFHELVKMAKGEELNTIVVVSDFPPELMNATEDIGGYNVTRKQTMLRVLTRKKDGNVQMYSQSLDGSNRQALEAIYARFGAKPEAGELLSQRIQVELAEAEQGTLADELKGIYDRSLSEQYGGEWHAGRQPADYRNTYDFVRNQPDLINECIRLNNLGWLNDDVMYKMAATMQKRFRGSQQRTNGAIPADLPVPELGVLYREIEEAGARARQMGVAFSACGVTLGSEGLDQSTRSQFEQAGYGNKADEDEFGSLTFKCGRGHSNTRPRHQLIDECSRCGISVKC